MSTFLGRLSETQLKDKAAAQEQLASWKPRHEHLACFDVDGHILDNMTAKQVIVFIPHFMDIFGLRDVERHYRLHAEYHNLWSTDRGCDRHEAKSLACGSLLQDPSLAGVMTDDMRGTVESIKKSIDAYIAHIGATGGAYGFDSLHAFQKSRPADENLTRLCIWSKAVDLTFPFVTIPMQPFAGVREVFEYLSGKADVLIVSKTPYVDICNWLEARDLIRHVRAVAGKEQGNKDEHICLAMGGAFDAKTKTVVRQGSKYAPDHVIMGGDGGGDLKAVKKNGGYFFPTPPGREEQAWAVALDEVFRPFIAGTYGANEPEKIAGFEAAFLTRGPWEEDGYDVEKAYEKLQPKRRALYEQLKTGGKLFGR